MRSTIFIDKIDQYLPVLKSLNDTVRFVDPLKNIVIDYKEKKLTETKEKCYNCWCQSTLCDNCVSVNAYQQNSSLIKFVTGSGSIIMVTAIPVENSDTPLVMEIFNDVTTSLIFDSASNTNVKDNLEAVWMLDDMAIKDQLTSLYNRRFVDARLNTVLRTAHSKNNPVSVLFIDIDDFKDINDKFGHDIGDIALKEAAGIFNEVIRKEIDWAARFGGDEFVICLNHADEGVADIISERICEKARKINIPVNGEALRFTVSIGAHTMRQEKLTASEIIKIADQNMYKSKSEGKNRITSSVS